MKRIVLLLACLLLITSQALAVEKLLTLDDYRIQVKKSFPAFKLDSLSIKRAEIKIRKNDSYDDPVISAGIFNINSVTQFGAPPVSRDVSGVGANLAISQTTRHGGLSWNAALTAVNNNMMPNSMTGLSLDFILPLSRNKDGILSRFAADDAQLALDLNRVSLHAGEDAAMLSFDAMYFKWIYYRNAIAHLEKSVKNAKAIEKESYGKLKDGLIDPDHYYSAAASVYQYEDRLLQNRFAQQSLLRELEKNGLDLSGRKPDLSMWSKQTAVIRKKSHDVNTTPFDKTASGLLYSMTEKRLDALLVMKENMNKPVLNLSASSVFGAGSSSSAGSLSDGLTEQKIGLVLTHTLENRAAESSITDIKIQKQSLAIQEDTKRDEYSSKTKTLLDQLDMTLKLVKNKKAFVDTMKKRHAAEMKKYNTGRMNLSDVIRTRNILVMEEINLLGLNLQLIESWIKLETIILEGRS